MHLFTENLHMSCPVCASTLLKQWGYSDSGIIWEGNNYINLIINYERNFYIVDCVYKYFGRSLILE